MTAATVPIVGAGLVGARAAGTLRAEGFDGRVPCSRGLEATIVEAAAAPLARVLGPAVGRPLGVPVTVPPPLHVESDRFGLHDSRGRPPQPARTPQAGTLLARDSFAVRYLAPAGRFRAALLANRPGQAAELRRRLAADALPLAA